MNPKDFVVVPGNKAGLSVKLKTRNLQELRLETAQLELESHEMEQKLQQLQLNMSREKEERERSAGIHWRSGQRGVLGKYGHLIRQNKENSLPKASPGKMRIKLLKDKPEEPPKPPAVSIATAAPGPEVPKIKGKACGQCEARSALLVSRLTDIQTGAAVRLVCAVKGTPAGTRVSINSLDAVSQFKKQIDPNESTGKHKEKEAISGMQPPVKLHSCRTATKGGTEVMILNQGFSTPLARAGEAAQNSVSLLNGSFDEEGSAESFQEALQEWRHGRPHQEQAWKPQEALPVSVNDFVVQTNPPSPRRPLEINFTESSLSYMEKLMVRKHRRTPVDSISSTLVNDLRSLSAPTPPSEVEEGQFEGTDLELTAEEQEDHEYYTSLFTADEPSPKTPRAESFLTIIELNEVEENPEESVSHGLEIKDTNDSEKHPRNNESVPTAQEENQKVCSKANSYSLPIKASQGTKESVLRSTFSVDMDNPSLSSCDSKAAPQEPCMAERMSCRETQLSSGFHRMQRKVQGSPFGWSPRQNKSTEKRTNANPATSSSSTHKTSLLSNVALVDSPPFATASEGRESSLALHNSTVATSVGLATKPSMVLHEVAVRDNSSISQYRGLEGFFTVGLDPKQVKPDPFPTRSSCQTPAENKGAIGGNGEWRPCSSLSDQADESFVRAVIDSTLSRPSSSRGQSTPAGQLIKSQRPFSASASLLKASPSGNTRHHSSATSRPGSAIVRPLSRAASEISDIESIDITEQDEPDLETVADQQALAGLEEELKILNRSKVLIAGKQRSSQASTSAVEQPVSKRRSVSTAGENVHSQQSAIQKSHLGMPPLKHAVKSHAGLSSQSGSDGESQTDNEEERDKQNVLSLP
nr:PREDICTED: zinc finger B-box domain-containing protein 1 [Latimeria chalumnae]|eukprot:XP_014347809.1 PREDICTED: zinc finger B-box domain-containing protein 1 [Latimeria chalumnae]